MSTPWYSVHDPRPAASVRLYCLPGAGGDATMFRPWADHLPPHVELRAIRLPGRHAGHAERVFTDCREAADTLAAELGPELRRPYVLFGHSMGALLGYQLVRAVARRGLTMPALFISASWLVEGIDLERLPDPDASDERFLDVLRRLGGAPPEVLADPEVLAFTLPVLRADFRLCRTYAYQPDLPPLGVPVTAMGGVADTVTPVAAMAGWRHHADRFLGTREFPGNHFFVREHVGPVVRAVVDDITAVTSGARAR